MKEKDILKREEKIAERIAEIKATRGHYRKYHNHVRSDYFRDALSGNGPYVTLAKDRATYLERHAHYAAPVADRVASLIEESSTLPVVESQRWDRRRDVRIGIIADRFLFDSLEAAAHLVPLHPSRYEEQIGDIDILLVTSAWRGLEDEWLNIADQGSAARQVLEEGILPAARRNDVPVVFYSKEDPPNFAKFSGLAKLADLVFTSAIESVAKYHDLLGDDVPVGVLPFAVNYRHHNPLGSMRHEGREFVFAGSWFEHKYVDRRVAAQKIFDGLLDAGADLTIIDRNLDIDESKFSQASRYLYPERYLPHLHGPVDHETLLGMQRLLPVGINLNSVGSSQTMFANRVIEMQAMGTLMLSNYSAGVNSLFPQIVIPDSRLDAQQFYESLTRHSIRDAQVAGIRSAFSENTAFDRIDTIVSAVGLGDKADHHAVHVRGLSEEEFRKFSAAQTYTTGLHRIDETDGDQTRASADGDIVIDLPQGAGEIGPNLVRDVVNAFRYADVDAVTVHGIDHADPLYEYATAGSAPGAVRASWVEADRPVHDASVDGGRGLLIAGEVETSSRETVIVGRHEDWEPEISIVVPVYNNGRHLKFKCFESLRRSSVFDHAEILLVDDGSTDIETRWIVDELDARYSNVRVHRFPEGGSGSASRPRNKGLEMAAAPYITYLDPDNELTNDGFEVLLNTVREGGLEFAIGDMIRFKWKRATIHNHRVLKDVVHDDGSLEENALSLVNYQPMSIQALVADTAWLRNIGIYQPVGAVGQDSYFFQQMLYHATKIAITKLPIHTYYAGVANSTVNAISPRFYEKYLPLEEDRSAWLRSVGLLEDYNERRLERFVKGWYVQKLAQVAPEDAERCRQLIGQLVAMFDKESWNDPELTAFFAEGREHE